MKDANGQQIAYLYFEGEPQRQMSMKRLSRDEAFLLAVNIAKLPSVPRQILKDIPRPAKFGQSERLSECPLHTDKISVGSAQSCERDVSRSQGRTAARMPIGGPII